MVGLSISMDGLHISEPPSFGPFVFASEAERADWVKRFEAALQELKHQRRLDDCWPGDPDWYASTYRFIDGIPSYSVETIEPEAAVDQIHDFVMSG